MGFYTIPTDISVYLISNKLGGPAQAGYALALSTGTATVMGLMVARIRMNLGRMFVPSILFMMLLCHTLMAFTSNVLMVNIAMIANGYTLSMAVPYVMMRATESSNGHNVGATSLVTSFLFLGSFCSPIVLDGIARGLNSSDPAINFKIVAVGTAFIFLYTIIKSFQKPLV